MRPQRKCFQVVMSCMQFINFIYKCLMADVLAQRSKVHRFKVHRSTVHRSTVHRSKVHRSKVHRSKVHRSKVHRSKVHHTLLFITNRGQDLH